MTQPSQSEEEAEPLQHKKSARNFATLIVCGVLVRLGWIFKTESIVMPVIMDSIGGGGWLRGCLPMLNRLGQSFSPLIGSEFVRGTGRKKYVLAFFLAIMGFSFVAFAVTWFLLDGKYPGWLPYLFLLIYAIFWFSVGLHNLSQSLLQGKLVVANRRGRLFLLTTSLGSVFAISGAWFLMRRWLASGAENFVWLFVATAIAMLAASLVALTLVEDKVVSTSQKRPLSEVFQRSLQILKTEGNFRLLAIISATYGLSVTLIPHYQAYVRENLEWGLDACVPWVISQNLGAAAFSVPIGQLADRYGYRAALMWTMIALCVAPLLTIYCLRYGNGWEFGFQLVFFLLGLTPVTMRTFSNYTLEIADSDSQPVFLSTLGICMAAPVIILSAPVGALVDLIGFESVFIAIVLILLVGWLLTFGLQEPRRSSPD